MFEITNKMATQIENGSPLHILKKNTSCFQFEYLQLAPSSLICEVCEILTIYQGKEMK